MTSKRDLKKRIRDRAARTGERYTTARQHVVARPARPTVPFIDMQDVSKIAARVGILCPVTINTELAQRVDCSALLTRIRDVLRATEGDEETELLRSVMLRGERPQAYPGPVPQTLMATQVADALAKRPTPTREGVTAFIARTRAGIGGVNDNGTMLALPVVTRDGLEMIMCILWGIMPRPLRPPRAISVVLATPDDFAFPAELLAIPGWWRR